MKMKKNELELALGKLEIMIRLSQVAFDELFRLAMPKEKKKAGRPKKSKAGRPRKLNRNESASK